MVMPTPSSESDDRPPKRMRNGTRSCAECRRRKVRCIFTPNSRVCEECLAHDAACVSQQSAHPARTRADKAQRVDAQQRLESLEVMVRHICKAMNLDLDKSSLNDFETSATEALNRLGPASAPKTRLEQDVSIHLRNHPDLSGPEIVTRSSTRMDNFEDAPLLGLFKEAMLIQRNDIESDKDPQPDRLSVDKRNELKTSIATLNGLIPRLDTLTLILEFTEKFWPCWPLSSKGPVSTADEPQLGRIASARDLIVNSLRSGCPIVIAKSVLWLALCIQHLPRSIYQQTNLHAAPHALLDAYLNTTESLLSVDNSVGTIEGLGCLMLQAKVYINMGKPRKAWLSVRRAVNLALLLGLHHPENSTDEGHKALWAQIWQTDRQLSVILGLPCAIEDSHPGLSKDHAGQHVAARVMYELSIIAGQIIERNQRYRNVDYSVTLRIDQELQLFRNGLPTDWWDNNPNPTMPLEAFFLRQVLKLYYYQLCKLLHLPYMLKSAMDQKYENSRMLTLEASRGLIRCYQALRDRNELALIMCDLMDFQVFSAAIALAINLLSHSSQRGNYQHAEDWELVHGTSRELDHISRAMDCTVAGQAARLLEYLSMARNGTFSGPEGYEAVIPYFGKVRISQLSRVSPSQTGSTSSNDLPIHTQQPFSNTIEFSANSFMPSHESSAAGFLSDAELGIDWTSIFDTENQYEWNQLFDNTGL